MIIQKNLNKIHTICKEHEEKKYEKKLDELSKKTEKDKDNKEKDNKDMNDVEPNQKAKISFEDYEIQTCVLGMTLVCFGENISCELVLRS